MRIYVRFRTVHTKKYICNEKKLFLKTTTALYLNQLTVQQAFIEGKSKKYIHSILISKHVEMTTPLEQHLLRFTDFTNTIHGTRGGVVVKALSYKPTGSGFDSRWFHWNFSVT